MSVWWTLSAKTSGSPPASSGSTKTGGPKRSGAAPAEVAQSSAATATRTDSEARRRAVMARSHYPSYGRANPCAGSVQVRPEMPNPTRCSSDSVRTHRMCARLSRTLPSSAVMWCQPSPPRASSSLRSSSSLTRSPRGGLAWNPMLMRWAMSGSVSFRRLDDLCQYAARRPRVHEGDTRVANAPPRRLVDELQAAVAERVEGRLDVADAVRDVVQPGPAAREEAADGAVGRERPQKLHVAFADVEQHRLDALLLDHLAVRELHAVRLLVQRDRGVEVVDGDADVVDAGEHG